MKLLFKNKFWVILLCCLFFSPNSFSAVHNDFSACVTANKVPPAEKKKKAKNKRKARKNRNILNLNKKNTPLKIHSPRVGKAFIIVGIISMGIAVIAALLIIAYLQIWPIFFGIAIAFLFMGLFYLIMGLVFTGRNKDWDIDYR